MTFSSMAGCTSLRFLRPQLKGRPRGDHQVAASDPRKSLWPTHPKPPQEGVRAGELPSCCRRGSLWESLVPRARQSSPTGLSWDPWQVCPGVRTQRALAVAPARRQHLEAHACSLTSLGCASHSSWTLPAPVRCSAGLLSGSVPHCSQPSPHKAGATQWCVHLWGGWSCPNTTSQCGGWLGAGLCWEAVRDSFPQLILLSELL